MHQIRKRESNGLRRKLYRLAFNKLYQQALFKRQTGLPPTANQSRAVVASMTPRQPEEWREGTLERMAHRAHVFRHNEEVRQYLSHGTRLEPQDRQPHRPFAAGPVVVPTEFLKEQANKHKNHLNRKARKAKKAAAKKRQAEA